MRTKIKWILLFMTLALIVSSTCYAAQWAKAYGGSDVDFLALSSRPQMVDT